jgi:hypothetical protein
VEVARDLLAEPGSLDVGGPEVDPGPHARVMFSSSASEKRSKVGVVPDLLLDALKAILSVPKKYWRVRTIAPAAQLWPEGCSGNGGVTSAGGVATGVDGSNSGVHVGSAEVAAFPSLAASRMAVIGRQKFQWYLSFQQPIAASAAARFPVAKSRALSTMSSCRRLASVRSTRFQKPKRWSCQKIAASVSSGVRVVLSSAPTFLISLESFA